MERLNKGDKLWIAACVMMAIAAWLVGFAVGRSRSSEAPAVAKKDALPSSRNLDGQMVGGMKFAHRPDEPPLPEGADPGYWLRKWAERNALMHVREMVGPGVSLMPHIGILRFGDGHSPATAHIVKIQQGLGKKGFVVLVWQTDADRAANQVRRIVINAEDPGEVGTDFGYQ